MPNVGSVLRDEISRLSRREIKKQTATTKKAAAQHRHHIAALNRKVVQLERQVALLTHKVLSPRASAVTNGGEDARIRFVAKGLHSNRNRLGLSAADFGRLLGVSAQSVYNWERGEATPRSEQLAKIASLRGIGKREVTKRLELLQAQESPPPRKRAKRSARKRSA
jgi:DNA-binding transcriptional regulator YiaG